MDAHLDQAVWGGLGRTCVLVIQMKYVAKWTMTSWGTRLKMGLIESKTEGVHGVVDMSMTGKVSMVETRRKGWRATAGLCAV